MSGGAGKIAVLDFGGQYTQLIARRVREMSVYSEIFSCTHPLAELLAGGYQGIILSGGPSSVYEDGAPLPPKELFDAGINPAARSEKARSEMVRSKRFGEPNAPLLRTATLPPRLAETQRRRGHPRRPAPGARREPRAPGTP